MAQRRAFADYFPANNALTMHHSRPQRQMAHDRVCTEGLCDTILSIYNRESTCSIHTERKVFRNQGKRIHA